MDTPQSPEYRAAVQAQNEILQEAVDEQFLAQIKEHLPVEEFINQEILPEVQEKIAEEKAKPAYSANQMFEYAVNGRFFSDGRCLMRSGAVYGVQPNGWRRLSEKKYSGQRLRRK